MTSLLLGLLGRLPFSLLYLLSDATRLLVHRIARYRVSLVRSNLAAAFPEKSAAELRTIERAFYRNFCDYFFETVKLAHISDGQMRRRIQFEGVEIIDQAISSGRSVAVYFAHCFNWEWAPSVTLWSRHAGNPRVAFCQVYRPLKSRAFDRWFRTIRARFGSHSIAKRSVARDLLRFRREGITTVTGFMSDQKVSHLDSAMTVSFLNRPTEAIAGTEELCRRLGLAPVYWDMHRTGRGRYRIVTRRLPDENTTEAYFAALETTIRRDPSNWLWSHNRWKSVAHPHPTANP